MSNNSRTQQLHIAIQNTRVANARFMANVSTWSMDTDTPVDIDVFALIIAMSQHLRPNAPFNYWTLDHLTELQFAVHTYCRNSNTFEPKDFNEQLQMFIMFLDETNWLHEKSDNRALLLDITTRTLQFTA